MTWLKRLLPVLALSSILTSPTFAQITGHPIEFSAGAGAMAYDVRTQFEDGFGLHGTLGYRLAHWATLEASATYGSSQFLLDPHPDATFMFAGLGMRFNLRPAESPVVPFAITEIGYGRAEIKSPVDIERKRGVPSLGAGALFSLFGNQRVYARVQVSDLMFRGDFASTEYTHNFAVTAAVHYVLGGKPKDRDLDKVRDWLDQCPDTPPGATVNAQGCPSDADADSIVDGVDKCPDTPRGCVVDKTGCPLDADKDGVCDGNDSCAATPAGAKVDAKGCPLDTDGDGIFDGLDQCENTPAGAKIDDKGCPLDADGDGVPDGIDTCEKTPAGAQVDATGCETAASKLEGDLLDTGRIKLSGVQFGADGAPSPESVALLDQAAEVLAKWPELKIEIGVHTGGQGKAAANLKASKASAAAIRASLLQKYPTLNGDNLVAKGYGDGKPLVPGSSEQARAINRRVEYTVLNKSALVQAGGKRRLGGR